MGPLIDNGGPSVMAAFVFPAVFPHLPAGVRGIKQTKKTTGKSGVVGVIKACTTKKAMAFENFAMTINENRCAGVHGFKKNKGKAFDSGRIDEKSGMVNEFGLENVGDEAEIEYVRVERAALDVSITNNKEFKGGGVLAFEAGKVVEKAAGFLTSETADIKDISPGEGMLEGKLLPNEWIALERFYTDTDDERGGQGAVDTATKLAFSRGVEGEKGIGKGDAVDRTEKLRMLEMNEGDENGFVSIRTKKVIRGTREITKEDVSIVITVMESEMFNKTGGEGEIVGEPTMFSTA